MLVNRNPFHVLSQQEMSETRFSPIHSQAGTSLYSRFPPLQTCIIVLHIRSQFVLNVNGRKAFNVSRKGAGKFPAPPRLVLYFALPVCSKLTLLLKQTL